MKLSKKIEAKICWALLNLVSFLNAKVFKSFKIDQLIQDQRANMMSEAADIIGIMFLLGSVGIVAFGLVANLTAWTEAGSSDTIATIMAVGVVSMAAVGLMMLFINRRGR